MRSWQISSFVAAFAVVSLAGCSGGAMQSPTAGNVTPQGAEGIGRQATATVQSPAQARVLMHGLALPSTTVRADRRGSWMAPDAKRQKRLLYVANEAAGNVSVFLYPTHRLVGTLTGFNIPTGICTNRAGNVFIMNGGGTTIDVYAHGGTAPLRSLDLGGYPWFDCSVDPNTGTLATSAIAGAGSVITVFKHATGIPTTYTVPNQNGLPGCAYDRNSNLFCDAFSSGSPSFSVYELPRGAHSIKQISINDSSVLAGAMQWDGKYFAFTNGSSGTIEQLQVTGSSAAVVGSTQLNSTGAVWQFWLPAVPKNGNQATRIIAPTSFSSNDYVGYWNYPAGGDATATIDGLSQPDGVALSVKP